MKNLLRVLISLVVLSLIVSIVISCSPQFGGNVSKTEREKFKDAVAKETQLKDDQDFQQTVQVYQQLKAKQVKQIFQQLLSQDMADHVVEYLAAMQVRKAAAVIREFKSPAEVVQAADLLQSLRERGLDFSMEDLGNAGQAQQSLATPNAGDTS